MAVAIIWYNYVFQGKNNFTYNFGILKQWERERGGDTQFGLPRHSKY